MKLFWRLYALGGALLFAYSVMGLVVSYTPSGTLLLMPGQVAETSIFRLHEKMMQLTVRFPRDDVGKAQDSPEAIQRRKMAAAPMSLTVTRSDGVTRQYHAYRQTGYDFNPPHFYRPFSSLKPEKVDAWLPTDFSQNLPLAPGINRISLKVETVDPVLEGLKVHWIIPSPLGFKSSAPELKWLFWSLSWMIYLPAYALLGIVLALAGRIARSRRGETNVT
ncbi:MAG TPA: hypothetical protein PLQ11_11150 [Beijerinckiaceae bacterium]|nr:hypothetical protein [Beijerinckiaceae bacterium]